MNHRAEINSAFDKARSSLEEAGLSSNAKDSFERIRHMFTCSVYTEIPQILVFPSRKQIKIYCDNSSQEDAQCDGSFEATIEDNGSMMLIAKCLESTGCVHTKQWLISGGQTSNHLSAQYWLEYVKLPEPIDIELSGKEFPWIYLLNTIDLNYYNGPLDFYALNVVNDRHYYISLIHIEEMSHTRYYDVYEVPYKFYILAKIKHASLSLMWKIMPKLYEIINSWYIKSHNKEWYDNYNSFPNRWFKKVGWTKF